MQNEEEAYWEHIWASHTEKVLRMIDATRAVTHCQNQNMGPTLSDLDLDASADHRLGMMIRGYSWVKDGLLAIIAIVILAVISVMVCICDIRCCELHLADRRGLHLLHRTCNALIARKAHWEGR